MLLNYDSGVQDLLNCSYKLEPNNIGLEVEPSYWSPEDSIWLVQTNNENLELRNGNASGGGGRRNNTPLKRNIMRNSNSASNLTSLKLDLIKVNENFLNGSSFNGRSFLSLNSSDEDDDDEYERPILQRSSSLKTGKTPPGTPGRKKFVRFADTLGLDLADVRTFLDEIPQVPKSAYRDLVGALESLSLNSLNGFSNHSLSVFSRENIHITPTGNTYEKSSVINASTSLSTSSAATASVTTTSSSTVKKIPNGMIHSSNSIIPNNKKTLVPNFNQPVTQSDFFDKIRDQKVLLENGFLGENFTIKGAVRVMNMDFHKSVYIRYSLDDWKTFVDSPTNYVSGSCDGFSDRFEFKLILRSDQFEVGTRFSFAVRFHCQGQQFWDNNNGRNYIFQCVPSTSQSHHHQMYDSQPEDPWLNPMWM